MSAHHSAHAKASGYNIVKTDKKVCDEQFIHFLTSINSQPRISFTLLNKAIRYTQ